MAGYLFVHFTGEQKDGEQIYFSISRDGLHWEDLNDGQPVLYSHLGMQGVRDPFLLRDPKAEEILSDSKPIYGSKQEKAGIRHNIAEAVI